MALNLDPHSVALEAARLIRKRGLAKHTLMDDCGAVCFNGAIMLAMIGEEEAMRGLQPSDKLTEHTRIARLGTNDDVGRMLDKISAVTVRLAGIAFPSLLCPNNDMIDWNNSPGRTLEQVAFVIEQAASELTIIGVKNDG